MYDPQSVHFIVLTRQLSLRKETSHVGLKYLHSGSSEAENSDTVVPVSGWP